MSWLLPGFLAGTLAIGLPVLLHFLRSKPKTVIRFPSLRFLAPSALRDTRRHRLQRWITLALRCLLIALLAAAFARPFFARSGRMNERAMVVAVDHSMSMQAAGRWEASRRWALAQLDDLEPGDEAGILRMHPTPTWLVPLSPDLAQARAALQQMEPGFESTRYSPALRMAAQTLAARPARIRTLVWMADEQRLGWLGTRFDEPLPDGVEVRFAATAPAPEPQAAITSVRWSRDGAERGIEARVRLFAPETHSRELIVKAGGRPIARQPVALKSGEEMAFRLPLRVEPEVLSAGVSVSLSPADSLLADDTAWLAPVPEASRTVLFSKGADQASRYLAHAFAALGQVESNDLAGKPLPEGEWPADSVVMAMGDCFQPPLLEKLERFRAAGGALWIVVDGSPGQMKWLADHGVRVTGRSASGEPGHLRDWDLDHPILTAFTGQSLLPLMEVGFERSFSLSGDNLRSIASWPDGTSGLAELTGEGGRVFLSGFAFDRSATDWLVQPSFVPFIHQAARWLAATLETRTDWRVGDTIPLRSSEGLWRAAEAVRPVPAQKTGGAVRAEVPGLYEFSDGHTRQLFAVNVPAAESDLAPWPDPDQLLALQSKASAPAQRAAQIAAIHRSDQATESQQRLWWWLLAGAGLALVAELAVANRTAM